MNSCTFCDIVNGTSPAYVIYQDNDFLAFLDTHPYGYGHTLVIPKNSLSLGLGCPRHRSLHGSIPTHCSPSFSSHSS